MATNGTIRGLFGGLTGKSSVIELSVHHVEGVAGVKQKLTAKSKETNELSVAYCCQTHP